MNKLIVATLIIGMTLSAAAGAQAVYRWVDKDGVVHYGARAPEGVEATLVNTASPPGGLGVSAEDAKGPQDGPPVGEPEISYAEQRRRERAERREKAMQEDSERQSKCAAMERQRAALEPSPRVIIADADGNPVRMADEDRLAKLDEAKSYLSANCR